MLRFDFIAKCTLFLLCLLLASCADDIPELLTKEDVEGMLLAESIPSVNTNGNEPLPTQVPQKDGMALIPAGEFSMGDHHNVGDNDEEPVHTVYLDEYYIDVYEVTNAQYAKFLNEHGKNEDAKGHELLEIDSSYCLIEKVGGVYKSKADYEDHPVIKVSWYGAAAYAQFYGKRLPTEAEWEKATRGGLVGKKYPWGDNLTHDDANYYGTGGKDKWEKTSPVGSFPANGYGLFDMAGNVWELCADEYDSGYYSKSPGKNPLGPGTPVLFVDDDFTNVVDDNFTNVISWRVVRGASWGGGTRVLRCADRGRYYAADSDVYQGFRCVVSSSSFLD